jgi:hypothetical protein
MKYRFLTVLTLAVASPVWSQTPPAPSTEVQASTVATEVATKLFPDGTYRKLLGPTFTQMVSGMVDNMTSIPLGGFLRAVGLDEQTATELDKVKTEEIMAILDPAYKQRLKNMTTGMFSAMIPLFEKIEPDLRDGLALSLQSKFSQAQLEDLKSFFATPTGASFASQQMLLFTDPAVMGKMQAQMPKIMATMPEIIGQLAKSGETLPRPRKFEDLSEAERKKIIELLGIDPKKVKQ